MVVLTYKIKHNRDFSNELQKARLVAEYVLENGLCTTPTVKHIGLKSTIANAIIRKYGRNHKIKSIKSVKLTVPGQGVRRLGNELYISCLKLILPFNKDVIKINQIELNNVYAYVSCSVEEQPQFETKTHLGVDRNTTGNIATIAIKETGKVWKLGKQALHIRQKYFAIRRKLQKQGRYKIVKRIKNKESRIVRDINHKISRKIIDLAKENASEIRLEDLKGIRKAKTRKSFKGTLNSWAFYQLGEMLEYKAQLAGVKIFKINPAYTSKSCSRCGKIGERNGKIFKCHCGHVEHADVNAAFNIAFPSRALIRLQEERDSCKRRTDEPQGATIWKLSTSEPQVF